MGFDMTPRSLKKLCRELKLYSSCPELNEVLHLHQKGITKIKNLEQYIGLRTIYLECNAISKIEGLEALVELRCLYLNQNLVEHVEGLENLKFLETLDLSDNQIKKIHGLSCCPSLRQLGISGNRIRDKEDVLHLLDCKSLQSLDISKNRIDNEEALQVLRSLPLSLLRVSGNSIVSSTRFYRRTTIAMMPTLKYLDESPVFDKERRLAHAWVAGGVEAEKNEREVILQEEAAERDAHRQAFHDMVQKAKAEVINAKQESVSEDMEVQENVQQDERKFVSSKMEQGQLENDKKEAVLLENAHSSETNHFPLQQNEDYTLMRSVERDILCNKRDSCMSGIIEDTTRSKHMKVADELYRNEQSHKKDCLDVNIGHNYFQEESIPLTVDIAETSKSDFPLSETLSPMNTDSFGILGLEQVIDNASGSINNIKDADSPSNPITSTQSVEHQESAEKEREFKEKLQECMLQRAAADAQELMSSKTGETTMVNGMQEMVRPVIWGTSLYKDLWIRATNIDDATTEDLDEGAPGDIFGPTSMELDVPGELVPAYP